MVGSTQSVKDSPASNSEVEEDLANNNDPNNNALLVSVVPPGLQHSLALLSYIANN